MHISFSQLLTAATVFGAVAAAATAHAALVTDPNDARNWQGATVGTFAELYFGSNTLANRQQVVDDQLLDDSIFDAAGYAAATLVATPWTAGGNSCACASGDLTGTGSYNYGFSGTLFSNANSIDNYWFQSSGTIGQTVFDLGGPSNKAAVFTAIDHGPLPQEAIESTVYLSNDQATWVQAVVRRVFLEGFHPTLGILWDGYTYVVDTGTSATFRYASIIHGGPGALINDGDDEINGMMGLRSDFTPVDSPVPTPGALALLGLGLLGFGAARRRLN